GGRAHGTLVLQVTEHRAVQLVRTRLSNGVDEPADEPPLSHVEGRHEDLVLLHRLDRERACVDATPRDLVAGREGEEIVVDRAVDLNVVKAVVLTGERRASPGRLHDLRRGVDEIVERAVERRQPPQGGVRDEGLGTGPRLGQEGVRLRLDRHGFQLHGGPFQTDVEHEALASSVMCPATAAEVTPCAVTARAGANTRTPARTPIDHTKRFITMDLRRTARMGYQGATKMPAAGRDVNSARRHIRVTPSPR